MVLAPEVDVGLDLRRARPHCCFRNAPVYCGAHKALVKRVGVICFIVIGPPVVHARRVHRDHPSSQRDPPGAPLAVADDQGVTLVVAFAAVCLQVRSDLGLHRRHEHPARPLAGDLVEQESRIHFVPGRLFLMPSSLTAWSVAQRFDQ